MFHAGRNRVVGSPGPPGPPGLPGIPGTFSGSLEDISTRIIAYIQRESYSTAVEFYLTGNDHEMFYGISGSGSSLGIGVQGPPGPPGPPGPSSLTVNALVTMLQSKYKHQNTCCDANCGCASLNRLPLCDLGEDVRRYLSGPPGPQGPPGPPGTSVGISAGYSVDEIATYVFNIMNSECKWHISGEGEAWT